MSIATYGNNMVPLNIEAVLNKFSDAEKIDPLIRRFIELTDATSRAEKISNPDDWTPEQRRAYNSGDTAKFSRLRGYTEAEIRQFNDFMQAAHDVDAKYGTDTAVSISHIVSLQAEKK